MKSRTGCPRGGNHEPEAHEHAQGGCKFQEVWVCKKCGVIIQRGKTFCRHVPTQLIKRDSKGRAIACETRCAYCKEVIRSE